MKKVVAEVLIWFHVLVMLVGIALGWFVSIPIMLAAVFLHRLHLRYFGDCILTIAQRHLDQLPQEMDFVQFIAQRWFKKKITPKRSKHVSYACVSLSLLLSIVH